MHAIPHAYLVVGPMTASTVTISEASLQEQVIELAHLRGWHVAHFRPARTARGWRTPVAADGAGFPDLLMVRGGRCVAAELKAERGRLSPAQRAWLDLLDSAGVEAHEWRPSDWSSIEAALR